MFRSLLLLLLLLPFPAFADTIRITASGTLIRCCPISMEPVGTLDALVSVEVDPGPYHLPWMLEPEPFPGASRITGFLSGTFRDEPITFFSGWLDIRLRAGHFFWRTENHFGSVIRDLPSSETMVFSGVPAILGAFYGATPAPPAQASFPVPEPASAVFLLVGLLVVYRVAPIH